MNCSVAINSILADDDIIGPGTLAAVIATATVTSITVICAYLVQAVDETYLGSLDNRITTKTHRKWHTTIRRMYTDPSRYPHMSSAAVRAARQEAFTQFILSLSDEQLVTGLAILIAGLSHIRTITGYELTMVHALAWTTSTTHLITLSTLRNYLSTQGLARDARVVSMSALMVLLATLVFFTQPATEIAMRSKLPAECTFRFLPNFYSRPGTAFKIVVPLVVALNLTRNYVTRIQALYRRKLEDYPLFRLLSEARTERRLRRDQMYVDMKADGTGRMKQTFQRIAQAGHLYQSSFLSKLPDIAFNFCYGLSAVIYHRWIEAPHLKHGSNYMGFGQIVTLSLLALPVLVALTTYNDYRRKREETPGVSSDTMAEDLPDTAPLSKEELIALGLFTLDLGASLLAGITASVPSKSGIFVGAYGFMMCLRGIFTAWDLPRDVKAMLKKTSC